MFAGIYYCRVRLVIQRRLALSSSEDAPAPAKRRVSPRDAPRRVLRIRIILVYRATSPPSVHPSLPGRVNLFRARANFGNALAAIRATRIASWIGPRRRPCKRVGARHPDDVSSPMLKYGHNRIPCPIPRQGRRETIPRERYFRVCR